MCHLDWVPSKQWQCVNTKKCCKVYETYAVMYSDFPRHNTNIMSILSFEIKQNNYPKCKFIHKILPLRSWITHTIDYFFNSTARSAEKRKNIITKGLYIFIPKHQTITVFTKVIKMKAICITRICNNEISMPMTKF
jgi:hypothetical protein